MTKMKKLFWMVIGLSIAINVMAQQQGIVRTLERPGKTSVGIEGATLNVLEYPNAIVSKKGGKFSFELQGKRQGDSYTISRVQKKGYTLVDKQLQGRRFAYSTSVPLEIVMVSNQQLESDKKRIEDKAYNRAQKDYNKKVTALEKQLNAKAISEREYREKYEELSNNYNNYVQLIDQMAERYATTDYKGLSEINREILKCIENADLERADSLINSKGDFDKREQELANKQKLAEKTEQLSQQLKEDYNAELEDLVQDYYNKFTIHAANYRNDSAALYLERILRFYPDNIELLSNTADYYNKYLADYQRSLHYYQQALIQAQEQYGDINLNTGFFSERIGLLFDEIGDHDKALEWQYKALDIYEKMDEPDSARISMSYTLIGRALTNKEEYDKALEYTKKGLEIRERIPDIDLGDLSQSYNNLGYLIAITGDYTQALEYHNKALECRLKAFGPDDPTTAVSYNHLGFVNSRLGNPDKAIEYYTKALNVDQHVLGPAHPNTCSTLSYLGDLYIEVNNDASALDCIQQARDGYNQYYGGQNPQSVTCQLRIGNILLRQKNYEKAMEEYQECLNYYDTEYGAESYHAATVRQYIAEHLKQNGYDKPAIEYYESALSIYENLEEIGEDHLDMLRNSLKEYKEKIKQ